MVSSMAFMLLILSTLGFMPVLGRSTSPSAESEAALEQVISQQYRVVSSPLPQQHVFYTNSQKNFSWDDPELQSRLWSGQPERAPHGLRSTPIKKQQLQKRALRNLGTLIKIPSCLGCASAAYNGNLGDISQLTVMFLESVQIITPADLHDSCIFYTSILKNNVDQLQAKKLRPYFFNKTPTRLSEIASKYGCDQTPRLYSIWHVYSAGNDKTASSIDPKNWNYYVAEEQGTWLNEGLYIKDQPQGLGDQPKVLEYFENMSVAFANSCGGTIRVMSLFPKDLAKYGFIWGTKELPALRAKINSPGPNGVTNLISIDAVDPTLQYMVDWNTLMATQLLAKEDPLYYDPAQLSSRDTCDENAAYQLDGQDWFG
ncbi:hypothetical protein NPX13_g2764 [Xylaria arbuscula]|uniref:Uncharacterized protein n=1 Tax=Xylaria arbuscula TaxID=114810 RepID=A0A9W8NJ14_9PEZI|nr:hypothetical protein NPX13_g2764 [Xylaria arbuscula]